MTALPVIAPPTSSVPSCCGRPAEPSAVVTTKFHFSLNVSNLEASIAFYEKLFGVPPAKRHHDYAKFELDQPPLVFSLVPNPPSSNGALSHLGFPVSSTAEVEAAALRLQDAGLAVSCQEGTVCGYARQDKIWIADPDHNYWEIYVLHEDVDPSSVRASFDGLSPTHPETEHRSPISSPETRSPLAIWEHRVTDSMLERIPFGDESLDEVRLVGTFNSDVVPADRPRLLQDAIRVLKPGGTLKVHGLVSNVALNGVLPDLPGVAALVKRIPTEAEPVREIATAGFVNLQVTKLTESSVFQQGAAEMREIKITAQKPNQVDIQNQSRTVVYKGPFSQATDDTGQVYRRGIRVQVISEQWNLLASSVAAKQFLFIDGSAAPTAADCSCSQ